jgi:chromate reductase, NAD(P)H dehydrogenase (quinone)
MTLLYKEYLQLYSMITIISGSARPGSNTLKVAKQYQHLLLQKGVTANIFSLEGVNVAERNADFIAIENNIIIPSHTFVFVTPEYNGSFPGVLKMLFDTSRSHEIWFNKQALLVGNSTGRAGNLRGMDHLTDILNHMKITVHPNKLPISQVNHLLDAQGNFTDAGTLQAINKQLDEFINWLQPVALQYPSI